MASLWKHPNSSYWSACYNDKDGRRIKKSTKQTIRSKAMAIALEWERAEADAKLGNISTAQIQKVFNETVIRAGGSTIITPSTEKYLRGWLTGIETKNSKGTVERYKHTVDLLQQFGCQSRTQRRPRSNQNLLNPILARLLYFPAPNQHIILPLVICL